MKRKRSIKQSVARNANFFLPTRELFETLNSESAHIRRVQYFSTFSIDERA